MTAGSAHPRPSTDHRPHAWPQPRPPGTWQAITSLTVGAVALLLGWLPGINVLGALAAVVAVVLGVVGVVRGSRRGGPAVGMAIGGIITSVLAIVVSVAVLGATWTSPGAARRWATTPSPSA